MTTPSSGQISIGDLKSELNSAGFGAPSYDISLLSANSYNMMDGFYDTYGFNRNTFNTDISISNFYNLQTECAFDFTIGGTITQYQDFLATLNNQSSPGGTNGTYFAGNSFQNPTSGFIQPGVSNGINITHMDRLEVQVTCNNNKFPPAPPFANITIQYDRGTGLTNFPGSPFNGPSINVSTTIVDNAANSGTTPRFTVQCS
jgi:hypothetical protein